MLLSSPAVNNFDALSLNVTDVTAALCLIIIELFFVLVSQIF